MKREEILKLKEKVEKCGANRFKLDLERAIYQGEKGLAKNLPIPGEGDDKYYRACLYFEDKRPVSNIRLHLSRWQKEKSGDKSEGLGSFHIIGCGIKRKKFELLLEESKRCTDEFLYEILNRPETQADLDKKGIFC